MDATEKSKRKEKPKGGYRPLNPVVVLIGLVMLLISVGFLFLSVLTTCGCSPPSLDMTIGAIETSNAQVAMMLTQTSDAAAETATHMPSSTPTDTPTHAPSSTPTNTATPAPSDTPTNTPTSIYTSTATATATPTNDTSGICTYNWAYHESPKDEAAIVAALDKAGITGATLSLFTYGEDSFCGSGESATTSFYLMDITPTITIPAVANETPAESGARIEQILIAIQGAGTTKVHGVTIIFQSTGTEPVNWSLPWQQALEALENGIHGESLYAAGRYN